MFVGVRTGCGRNGVEIIIFFYALTSTVRDEECEDSV